MKKTILIILISVLISCNHHDNESNDLTGNWVSVKTVGIDSSGHAILNGYLLNISDNQYSYSHIFRDTTITNNYLLKNDTICFDDSTNIEIQSITVDSIKLIFRRSGSVVTYMRLPYTESKKLAIDKDALTSNSWDYILDTTSQRLEFLNSNWIFNKDDTKNLYTHPIVETPYYYVNHNRWRVFEFENRTYFVRSFEQHFGLLHEVYKVTSDTIFTKAWTGKCFEYPLIVKIKPLNQSELNKKQRFLTDKEWKVFEIDYEKGLLQDWQIPRVETRLNNVITKRNLRFDFKPKSCQILLDDTLFNFRNWKFTKDGEYLRLDSKIEDYDIVNFIKIEKISQDTLVIKNRYLFSEIFELSGYNDIDIVIKLTIN